MLFRSGKMENIYEKVSCRNPELIENAQLKWLEKKKNITATEYPIDSMEIALETDVSLSVNQKGIRGNIKFILHSILSNYLILKILPFVGLKRPLIKKEEIVNKDPV